MQLKSVLIMPLMMGSFGLAVWSGTKVWSTGFDLAWVGAFLATAAFPSFVLGVLMLTMPARTSARAPAFQLITVLGLLLAVYGIFVVNDPIAAGNMPIWVAGFGFVLFQWYVRVYSSYGRKHSEAITVGQPLPKLEFETLDGKSVSSAAFSGSKTLIVFFRANWCPLCMGQLKEIRERSDRLAAAGVQVKFVSNQSAKKSIELAAKFKLPDHIQILVDRDLTAAKTLGIEDLGGAPAGTVGYPSDTVMATVIALDADGLVIFGDETDNYRVRPHPDSFIPVFESSK